MARDIVSVVCFIVPSWGSEPMVEDLIRVTTSSEVKRSILKEAISYTLKHLGAENMNTVESRFLEPPRETKIVWLEKSGGTKNRGLN